MSDAILEFIVAGEGDSAEFIEKVQALAIGVVSDREPARLYVVRIDNWFGPKWLRFAGKLSVASGVGFGVHKTRLHVPPFVPSRVIAERVFEGPRFERVIVAEPLHIDCTSKTALQRRLEDVDNDAAFIWFSGESEAQGKGSVMIYQSVALDETWPKKDRLRNSEAFYAGFLRKENSWEPPLLRSVSRAELTHLEESGRAALDAHSPQTAR